MVRVILQPPEPRLDLCPILGGLIVNLDEDGLLPLNLVEISRYHHVPVSRIENLLRLIRRVDPIGVGSRSVKEALLIQLEVLSETQPVPPLAKQAIVEGFDLLRRRQYAELAKLLQVSTSQVEEIAQFIGANLNPFPARSHWGDIRQGKNAEPDVYHQSIHQNTGRREES